MEGINYDPIDDITTVFSTQESLNDIDSLIIKTRRYRLELQNQIENSITDTSQKVQKPDEEQKGLDNVFQDFQETQLTASKIYSTISNLTQGISHLDNAKRNITQSLTVFQNLKILIDSYLQCKTLSKTGNFLEMVSPYKIMCSLSETTFAAYKSVTEINILFTSISRLKSDVLNKIKQSYNKLLNGKIIANPALESQLREGACELLDSDSSTKAQIIDWSLNKLLYEIIEIFQLDDEAGSLENLSRRYMFFKKVLNNFNSKFAGYFLPSWEMPLALTKKFYGITRKDLDILLKKEFQNKTPSIDLFMGALQVTIDFEKYIDVRFSNKLKVEKLSSSFEPYLSLWVSHQDTMMEKKLLTYMSQSKLPENLQESLVVPSSADLFRTYRSVLSQTLELIGGGGNDSILISLTKFFSKWLIEYSDRVLKPLLLPDNVEIQNKEDVIKYSVLLVNTCDYCSTTISQLEEKLSQLSSNSQSISTVFMKTKDLYDDLLAKGNNLLLNRVIPLDLAFVWKEFDNADWAHVAVEDYSRYINTLKKSLSFSTSSNDDSIRNTKPALENVIQLLSRDVYKWNFFDKVIDLITSDYIDCITRLLQPLPPFAIPNNPRLLKPKKVVDIGEQLLLDIELLKTTFHTVLENVTAGSLAAQSTSFKRLDRHIEKNITLLLHFVKLLVLPLTSPPDYYESYCRLTDNNTDITVWAFILALKGISWELTEWQEHWECFKLCIDDSKEVEVDRDFFAFKWDTRYLFRFETNLGRIQDPSWVNFVKQELKIAPTKRNMVSR